ncbi:MAG: UDP-glucose/GDP-mannose dehydrogenase family protein [Acidobacteria bacterium]|nr:UDP-glucose/GDP-mannose dehydrogenase family protein [Acidobacteriota bacterium]
MLKMSEPDRPVLSVVGLGKLGAPFAACFASRGFTVLGTDADPQKVNQIRRGQAPVEEPGLQDLMEERAQSLTGVENTEEAVLNSDVTFIVVPTPTDLSGMYSLEYVLRACRDVAAALRRKSVFHLVIVSSTVMPGSMDSEIRPELERCSGKRCGIDFGLCYNPEFVALGSVVRDFLHPDLVLIGESDGRSGEMLEKIYHQVCETKAAIVRTNFTNAELGKLAVNTFITTKISFANTMARLCENLRSADVESVTSILGSDSRIGPKYLKGAVAYGGPCFPRDNRALAAFARQLGLRAEIAEATESFNRHQSDYLSQLVQNWLPEDGRVGILGLSYKPLTYVAEESAGVLLATKLCEKGKRVCAYDPAALENARLLLPTSVQLCHSAELCIGQSDVVVIATPWKQFQDIPAEVFRREKSPRVLIDCWRILRGRDLDGTVHIALGMSLCQPS